MISFFTLTGFVFFFIIISSLLALLIRYVNKLLDKSMLNDVLAFLISSVVYLFSLVIMWEFFICFSKLYKLF